jgi:hypothetical protein
MAFRTTSGKDGQLTISFAASSAIAADFAAGSPVPARLFGDFATCSIPALPNCL